MSSTNQQTVHKKRILQLFLEDECIIHLEIISCEKQINNIVELLTKNYPAYEIFISTKRES